MVGALLNGLVKYSSGRTWTSWLVTSKHLVDGRKRRYLLTMRQLEGLDQLVT